MRLDLLARVTDPPDRIRCVIGDEQRSIGCNGHTHWASPNLTVGKRKTREEIFVLAARLSALVQRHANHLVACAHTPIPGPMLRREDVTLIFCGKLPAFIEGQCKRGVVWLQ